MKSFDLPADEAAILNAVIADMSPVEAKPAPRASSRSAVEWGLPGICQRARVGTVFGDLPVEALRIRDELRTSNGTIARVQKIDTIHLDEEFLSLHPSALPVRIAANAFGAGKPAQEMLVSPQQEVSSEAHIAGRFVKAEQLQARVGALRASVHGATYYRFHCGEPVIIRVEGVWVRMSPW
ncbi:MAG: hypothetical protein DI533_09405 [Cereibacter sphaeroides]|uniref:Hedgehog/Intein (Hint) domain-containing protein n=1 Tax=Cereibacter sphaeroides TaxID=1063 RepID=A0A2W5SCN3_CERSP|nr:MAG: hypothetical protein DI533_09405 [Cereibacter sphaeroides]